MNTIEPRLIALLNNDELYTTYPASPSLELPPLQDPNILKASGRPLLLEPDTSKRSSKLQHASLASVEEDDKQKSNDTKNGRSAVLDRALGSSSPQSLRKILDNDTETPLTAPSKKRNIVDSSKDEFVQLPQPPKKQKATKQVVPPIIIGLFEPPPQAALFPPIASSSFHDSHGRNSLNTGPPNLQELKDSPAPNGAASASEKRGLAGTQVLKKTVKARKKWTEEETKNLLLGVHKHGVGRWTDILDDPSFSFNKRSGVDLKDRFRTCCPDELRRISPKPRGPPVVLGVVQKSKSSLMSENILIEEDKESANEASIKNHKAIGSRKIRAHRKKMGDLAQLGIDGPFRKSHRRERRPFTEQDDFEILTGYQVYGPAWSRIQRDTRFHLQSRQATDLRDRFRNKYPDKFRSEEAAAKDVRKLDTREYENLTINPQSTSRESLKIHQIISENEISTPIKVSLPHAQLPNFGYKDFGPFSADPVDGLPPFDWAGNAPFTESIGEMDISRLLLDEPWIDNSRGKEKQSYTGINSILTSSADDLHQGSSYYGLVNDEQINMPSSIVLDHDTSFGYHR